MCEPLRDVCSCAYHIHSANQQQEIRAVARKLRDAAGVLGTLKFANIIHLILLLLALHERF